MSEILIGDCRKTLRRLPPGTFHSCVTSPPYYGLRDYQRRGQIGLEKTPQAYVQNLVEVFRQVRRVLRDDGVVWLNLGDSYASQGGSQSAEAKGGNTGKHVVGSLHDTGTRKPPAGLKPGDLVGIPWRVALALQADGWYLRSDVTWAKPNPMPESVQGWRWEPCRVKTQAQGVPRPPDGNGREVHGRVINDKPQPAEWRPCPGCPKCSASDGYVFRRGSWRPTKAHEMVFLLAKTDCYFCDQEAVREPHIHEQRRPQGHKRRRPGLALVEHTWQGTRRDDPGPDGNPAGRNPRSVWTIPTLPSRVAHFAVMPPLLVDRCIRASTSEAGCCAACGAPFVRVVERGDRGPRRGSDSLRTSGQQRQSGGPKLAGAAYQAWRDEHPPRSIGFRPSCRCGGAAVPCRILDPFGGAGTVPAVAEHLGREATACELNGDYAALYEARRAEVLRWYARQDKAPARLRLAGAATQPDARAA